jgi:hypothetical protein
MDTEAWNQLCECSRAGARESSLLLADTSVISTIIPDDVVLLSFTAIAAAMGVSERNFDWRKVGKMANA